MKNMPRDDSEAIDAGLTRSSEFHEDEEAATGIIQDLNDSVFAAAS